MSKRRYIEGEGFAELEKCGNPLCNRLIKTNGFYAQSPFCCNGCKLAYNGKYEIHESGILGHSEFCNIRHERRKHIKL